MCEELPQLSHSSHTLASGSFSLAGENLPEGALLYPW